jgi:hypothetical protein
MEERPRDPGVERQEVIERREVVERDRPVDRVTVHERSGGTAAWIWIVPLLLVVLLLLWYVMTRGEPTQLEVPTIQTPTVEAPRQPDTRIEIQLPERAPAQPDAPAAQPTEPQPGS